MDRSRSMSANSNADLLTVIILALCYLSPTLSKDDKKWVWSDNNRDQSNARFFDRPDGENRYEVYEPERPNRPTSFLPQYNQPAYERPQRPSFTPVERPGGLYNNAPHYGGGGYSPQYPQYPPEREGPFKSFDRCKCTEKFNCNSPGLSYGHCDVGKQYCCYATPGKSEPFPSRPEHSIENGILVGPGGPSGHYGRPGRPGGFGIGGRPSGSYGPISSPPVHSPENGILVGPGGPFDRPGGFGGGYGASYGRANKNQ